MKGSALLARLTVTLALAPCALAMTVEVRANAADAEPPQCGSGSDAGQRHRRSSTPGSSTHCNMSK